MRKLALALGFATTTTAAMAGAQPTAEPSLAAVLSSCDSAFFKALQARPKSLAPQGQVRARGSAATFHVPNLAHPTDSKVFFNSPLRLHGLKIIGYFDEIRPIPGGVAVSWGFLISAPLSEAAERLKTIIWDAGRLREGDGYFVRSEVWRNASPEAGWSKEVTEPGPPKPGTVERVFMIEPYDGETAYIRAGCSLQGEVGREIMRELRPDFPLGSGS